ncbi:MAG: hypothetical protein ABIE70_00545 [bacterium]
MLIRRLLLVSLVMSVAVLAATGDYNDPATASGTNWTDPTNVFADDGSRTIYANTTQDTLYVTNFTVGVPSNAVIDSIYLRVNGNGAAVLAGGREIDVALTKNGSSYVGDLMYGALAKDTDADLTGTGATNPLWGATWTPAEINATTFGVIIFKRNTSADAINIDHVQLKVFWTVSISVSVGDPTFTFGTNLLNTWLTAQTSVITNDGTGAENFIGQISQFTDGTDSWTISDAVNGADQIRAQWSTTSDSGPWTDISAYATDFTIATGVAASGTVTLWFRIETPTSTVSHNEYSSTMTVTAE